MTNFMQRLDAAWASRYASPTSPQPSADDTRKPVCIITGGSEGIGRHLADEFAAEGHALLLIARNEDNLQQAASELRSAHGVDVHVFPLDLAAPDAVEQVQAALDSHGLYADHLVNNAAIGIGGPFLEQDADRLTRLIALNITALTALTRYFLPGMLKRQRGGVLNLASIGGLLPGPYQATYYASKAFVMSLTEALAHEYAGLGVRITVAAPGPVQTGFHKRMGINAAHYLEMSGGMSAERAARLIYAGYICRRRVIVPGFLASLAAFAVRYIPHVVLVPFIGWLIKRRY